MSDTKTSQAEATLYDMAWNDLEGRLTGGLKTLRHMLEETDSVESKQRLRAKIRGVRAALDIWVSLDKSPARATSWAEFTRKVFTEWTVATSMSEESAKIEKDARSRLSLIDREAAAYATGLALALDYQRGYAPGMDAPSLEALVLVFSRTRP